MTVRSILPTAKVYSVLALIAAIAVAAGCETASPSPTAIGSVAGTSMSPLPTPSLSALPASPTPSPTETAAATPKSPPALCTTKQRTCVISAGTYTTAPFVLPFEFTITSDWTNDRAWPHGGEIYLPVGTIQWASGVVDGIVGTRRTAIGPKPADFIAFLRKESGFTVSKATPVMIGGVSGVRVDLLTNKVAVQGIFYIKEDAYNVDAGERIRFMVLDRGDSTVILTMDAFKAADFDAFAAQARPVIDSIKWLP